jgi:hypothetical protein|eukprot:COSAG01_NODE_5254_length_4380_cov_3.719823_6_plen_83_part_00
MLYGQEATDPDDATKQMLAFVCVNHKCDAHGEPVRAEDSCVFQKVYKKTFIDVKCALVRPSRPPDTWLLRCLTLHRTASSQG